MARSRLIAVGGLFAALLFAASGSAASASGPGPTSPTRAAAATATTCDRAVGNFGRREVSIGRFAAVRGVRFYADPAAAARFPDDDGEGYSYKAPLAVRRGHPVTISIARSDRDWAELSVSGAARDAHTVRFPSCSRRAPRFTPRYDRKWASWPGGFKVERFGCLHLTAREKGSDTVSRVTLSFGMGDTCDAPPATPRTAARTSFGAAPRGAPLRNCRSRVEGDKPIPFKRRGDLIVGPVSFYRGATFADQELDTYFNAHQNVFLVKVPVGVRAGRDVTIAIAEESQDGAKLTFARRPAHAVRFKSCRRDEPAFSYDGVVGEATGFNGGFELKQPACVALKVWVRGRARPYRKTISLSAGDCATGAA